jgi:peptidoglycan/LPS O-acetylase OafA/YrhL
VPSRLNNAERFEVLDGMRGLAAVAVMVLHYTQQLHLRFTFNAYLAVDIFFALSGFVISHAYAHKLASGMTGAEFMARRVGRLFPLCALGVVMGLAALLMQSALNVSDMTFRDDLNATLLNLFFLPYFDTEFVWHSGDRSVGMLFPGDTPLWSIFFELLASFAFIELVKVSNSGLIKIVFAAIAALVILPLVTGMANFNHPINVNLGWNSHNAIVGLPRVFAGFVAGMLVYRAHKSNWFRQNLSPNRLLQNGLGPCALLIATLALPWTIKGGFGLIVIVIVAPLVVAWGSIASMEFTPVRKVLVFLGWLSFPIYCLHEPILTICQTLAAQGASNRLLGLTPEAFAAPLAIAFAIVAGWLFDQAMLQQRLTRYLIARLPDSKGARTQRPS